MSETKNSGVQSLERALNIIEALSSRSGGLGVSEISEVTHLHKSTVHRLLSTLRAYNYVYQDARTEKYLLGSKILEISGSIMDGFDVRTIARPVLEALCRDVGEAVHLCILDSLDAVYIDKIDNETRSIRMYSQIGKRIPVYSSASGKVLLAGENKDKLELLASRLDFITFTKYTIKNKESFISEISDISKRGYAVDWFEHEDSVLCIAAPIFNLEKKIVAAISVSAGIWNLDDALFSKMREEVYFAAKKVSKYMGCGSYPIDFNPAENDLIRLTECKKDRQ